MKNLTIEQLQKQYNFYDLPEEVLDALHDSVSILLTPVGMENATKGYMTIMDWKYKFDMIKDLII